MNLVIEVGDLVHARNSTEQGTVVAEFTVASIDAQKVGGGPLGELAYADGWTFELCRKGNPGLPETLAIVAAWMVQDRSAPLKIIGPDEGIWRDTNGNRVYPTDVLAWMPWGEYVPPGDETD